MSKASQREHVAVTSADPVTDRAAQLRALFPDLFADGKLDVAKLRESLGEAVAGEGEGYRFSWEGRTDAVEILRTPTRATLLPAPAESVDFDTTNNLYIEGDNLEVLKLLYKPYSGRVKLIYIDPPYNTGNDFIYPDDFRDTLANYLKQTGQSDDAGNLLRSNPETSGRYHSDWLSMMYPRLFIARSLLRDDGVIFVSIDDHEVHHLRMLMNEVFGEENMLCTVIWKRRQVSDNRNVNNVSTDHEYIIAFGKGDAVFNGSAKDLTKYKNPDGDVRGPWMSDNMTGLANKEERPNLHYELVNPESNISYPPLASRGWAYELATMQRMISEKRILWPSNPDGRPRLKRFMNELQNTVTGFSSMQSLGYTTDGTREIEDIFGEKLFAFPKPVSVPRTVVEQCTSIDEGDIVLDFFSGSATTAQAVLELNREDGGNRRFVLVQLPEPTGNKKFPTIAEIGKERIRRVITRMKSASGDLTRTEPEDLGFKVWKLAESHFALWAGVPNRTPEEYQKQMRLIAEEPLRPGWTAHGLLWEVALKEGYGLNSTIEAVAGVAATVYKVTDPEKDQHFLACLEDKLPAEIAKQLELTVNELFVVRDLALDDTLASNLALQCRLKVI